MLLRSGIVCDGIHERNSSLREYEENNLNHHDNSESGIRIGVVEHHESDIEIRTYIVLLRH